jgi:hypothetical protein
MTMTAPNYIQVPSGATTVTEIELPEGWKNTMNTVCEVREIDEQFNIGDKLRDAMLPEKLAPWEILICTIENDNSAFVKIKKITASAVNEDTTFTFNVTDSAGNNSTETLTVLATESMTMTASPYIEVPTGETTITEINIPDKWTQESVTCDIKEIDMQLNIGQILEQDVQLPVTLAPWEILECTVTNASFQGHTPGFWRNNADKKDALAWPEDPETPFVEIFNYTGTLNVNESFTAFNLTNGTHPTLFGAVTAEGGDVNALARHCVAAKLNAEIELVSPELLNYPLSFPEVIALCNAGFETSSALEMNNIKDEIAGYNELNNSGISQQYDWPGVWT